MPDRYDEDYKDESKTNSRLTGGGFGAEEKVDGSSDHPLNRQTSSGTRELYTLADDATAKAMAIYSNDRLFNPEDYRVVLGKERVSISWRDSYLGWRRVAEAPWIVASRADREELQHLYNHKPFADYIASACFRRTHHVLYFKEHGHGLFSYEKLLCIAWQKLSRVVRPGAAFNFYRTATKHLFMDAKRDGGRAIRMRGRYRTIGEPKT